MKLHHLIATFGLALALSACDQIPLNGQNKNASADSGTPVADNSEVLATVNGTPITAQVIALYQEQMKTRQPGANPDAGAVLQEVINLELARQKGVQEGLDRKARIQLQVDQQRRAVVAMAAIRKQLETHPVTDEEIETLYQEQVPRGNEYKARHILVKTEEEARKLIGELEKGADFSKLAKEHSTGPSGANGGDLGWFSPKQMVAPFSEAVSKLEKGQYTKEPVKTQFGWHVIILDDVRETNPPALDQVKPQLKAFLEKQRVQDFIAQLRQEADIKIKQQPPAAAPAPQAKEEAGEEAK
ncbi:MAG TPA: peptidylprolyl isomerase [Gammaproteobacteria bacterium]|nr:peptidylprolyl isomerase [Gammaproteobacteria bacterium]